MKKLIYLMLVVVGIAGITTYTSVKSKNAQQEQKINSSDFKKHEKRPRLVISEEEQAINRSRLERGVQSKSRLKSASLISSYANGKITGTWEQFRFLTSGKSKYGFRILGSVYDQKNDVLYAIPNSKHLWKINRNKTNQSDTEWELMNHKDDFTGFIAGLNRADGSFRMVRSNKNKMQYSDNEGRDWVNATGVWTTKKSSAGAVIKTATGNRVFALLTFSSRIQVYVSDDDGVSYKALSTTFNTGSHYPTLFKVHNSESVFLAVYNYSDSKVSIYEHAVDDTAFKLVSTSNITFQSLDRVFGTYHNGKYHFYVATKKNYIYYTSDKGVTWTEKQFSITNESGDTNPREVHPSKPNVLFRGYLDVYTSTNYGETFSNFRHALGWDVHHMKFYQRTDGSYFFFLGKDFGCYMSDNPELASNYISLNSTSPSQMCYDAAHSPFYNVSFSATQDRGTVGYLNKTNEASTVDVKTTDGLRVTLTNNDASVWTWMYYGSIFHKANFAANKSGLTSVGGKGSWWAAPMILSPNKKEDAVYLAYGNKLTKLTYNAVKQKIIETSHYYDFNKKTGSKISGFGYSQINPNRWYVSVKNGSFLYSENGGQTFTLTSYNGTKPEANKQSYNYSKNQHVIKASKIDEKTVYYAGVGNVFLISKDGGKTFTNHNSGLNIYRMRDFALSSDEKFIYAACGTGGVWVFSVDDNKWFEINDEPVPHVDYTDVEFNDKKNEVKFATYGCGVLTFKINGNYQNIVYPDNFIAEAGNNGVNLQWEDNSDNEDGFIIERSNNGVFAKVGEVSAGKTSYVDNNVSEGGDYTYRVKAFNSTGESYYSNYDLITISAQGEVDKTGWQLVSVNSQEANYGASKAFDNDESTMWHTQWSVTPKPTYPHTLVIDMKEIYSIQGFGYLARQDNQWNGTIKNYEFYVSTDNQNWQKVASGTWAKTKDEKIVKFSEKHNARYIKLVGKSEVNGAAYACCAEISVFTQLPAPEAPKTPQFVQGGRISDTEIELIWLDMSNDEDGFVVEQFIDGEFTPIHTSGADATSYIVSNINKKNTYVFKVISFNQLGDSDYSDAITIYGTDFNVGTSNITLDDEGVNIYPNPFKEKLQIEGARGYDSWYLYSISGKLLRSGGFSENSNNETIIISGVKPGNYLIRLEGVKGAISKTIIKQ